MFANKIFRTFYLLFLYLGSLAFLNACSEKATPPVEASAASPATTAAPNVRYLGLRLLGMVEQPDPKIFPLPTALAQELKECKFEKNDDTNEIKSGACVIQDLAPTYKQRPIEKLIITSDGPRCCLNTVTINPNQLTYENTLDLFKGIPGVKKNPENCPKIEPEIGRTEYFTISKDGVNQFVIQENTDGGSGGNQTSTTVYFGMPNIDCNRISEIEKAKWDNIREANTNNRSNQPVNQGKKSLVGSFKCTYTSMIALSTGASVPMKGKDSHTFRLQGSSGVHVTPTNVSEDIRLLSVTNGPAAIGYLYEPVTRGEVPFEYQFNVEPSGTVGGLLTIKKSPIGEVMAFGLCQKL